MGNSSSKGDLAEILGTLSQTDVSPEAHDFWDELWKLSTTPEDIFELIPPDDVRQLKRDRPENLVTLFTQAVAQLCQIVHTPVPMYFGQALNCVRILTRMLPFLLEDPSDEFSEKLCWSVEDEEEDEDEDDKPQPLARLVIHAAAHLLFLPGFTVDACAFDDEDDLSEEASDNKIKKFPIPKGALWAPGLEGFDTRPASAAAFDRNRIEILRLLLTALCEPLYQSADTYDPWHSRWLATATAHDLPNARLIFASLTNIIFSYDPIGYGVPYGGALFAPEAPTNLVNVSAQLLIALLDYGGQNKDVLPTENIGENEENDAIDTKINKNIFRALLAEIDGSDEFAFAFEGFARLLNNVHEAQNTTLPGSLAQIECYQEILVLLWKWIEENDRFLPYILRQCDITRIVIPICFLQYQARRDPARVGLVHICTFLLLKLSGERSFCVALNKPFYLRLPTDLPLFDGTHADLIIITLHKMIVNGGDKLSPLYNCFLTIICNISPYAKTLSLVTCVKVVNLFELFTSPRFFYQSANNHVYVALLLEIFNNVIQYQYGGNPHLIYAIVRRKQVFDALDNLTLPQALAQAQARSRSLQPIVNQQKSPAVDAAKTEIMREMPPAEENNNNVSSTIPTATDHNRTIAQLEQEEKHSVHSSKKFVTTGPRFLPNQAWLDKVKSELPLNTIMRLLQHLSPQIDELISQSEFALDESALLEFIKNTTMVGLLPVPHAIVIRKYQPNAFTSLWFTAFLWGVIFLQNQLLPLFDGASIKLFTVSVVN
uniref:HID1 domain-containing protein n=1 Tax=Aureoumbra lagunensis TaxID=44058 RepID=A0A7S3JVS4_9STRA|mmetsp:Transcript_23221/g.30068  ORF Transcript_23221/g.30068 Transcript_23221/m.30068 type:complete len:772 (-) Transcript_23221:865-3180(-)